MTFLVFARKCWGESSRHHRLQSLGMKAMNERPLPLSPSKTGVFGPAHASTEPKDRLGVYVMCFIGMVGVALACRIQIVYAPSMWAHLVIALPPVLLACLLPVWLLTRRLAKSRSRLGAEAKEIEVPANSSGASMQAAA